VHAAAVARIHGVAGVLVPPSPGVLCALGVLANDLSTEASRTRLVSERDPDWIPTLARAYGELEASARAGFGVERGADEAVLARRADVRYVGQNHELTVEVAGGEFAAAAMAQLKADFHRAHRAMFGYDSPEKPVEIVTLRVQARLPAGRVEIGVEKLPARSGDAVPSGTREVCFDPERGFVRSPVYQRSALRPGDRLRGPAIVEQMDCTTVVPPDFDLAVDGLANLFLTRIEGA
jgi:N-methylhydantoinase A